MAFIDDDKLWNLYCKIEEQIDNIGRGGHNIIGCVLDSIQNDYGIEGVRDAVRHFALDEKGWSMPKKIKKIKKQKNKN